ncbi:MAG: ABC transporter substrate-binding protein [Nocardioidaceae bacterium]|jgi:peptide/nickel transport system substrate-binding protein
MTFPAYRSRRRAARASAMVATVALGAAVAACTPVEPSGKGNGSSGGSASNSQDSFGTLPAASAVKDGGTLVMALSAEPDFLDPTLARSLYSRYVFSAMCEKLYDVDKNAQLVPQLATKLPQTSGDGKTLTIKLRKGVQFADGTDFNSQAVKTTLQRDLTNPQSARATELGPISGIDTPAPDTVVIHLKTPFAPLPAALADRAGMIMSPAALKKLGDKFSNAPVCVGPFKFAKRVPQNSIDVVKDPNYYAANKVHLDRISWHILTDASIRAANLRSGDVQVADTISPQDVDKLSQEPGLSVLRSLSLGYQGLTFNIGNVNGVGTAPKQIDRPDAKDARVRQALEYAIDRKGLVKAVFNDKYNVACTPISPTTQYSSPAAQKCRPHDPAKAKQLLKEAGVQTPYKITMLETNTPESLRLAQALQAMVKDGGFDLKVQPVEFTSLLDQQDAGDFDLLQLGWSGRVDPDQNITNFVGTGGSLNVSGYSNPALDKLLAQGRETNNLAQRRKLYGDVVGKLQQDDALIYLYRQANLTGVTDKVKGVQVFPDGVVRVAFAGFAK